MSKRPPAQAVSRCRLAIAALCVVGLTASVSACSSAAGTQDAGSHSAGASASTAARAGTTGSTTAAKPAPVALEVVDVSPKAGATVSTAAVVVVKFTTAPASGRPTISPAVAGTWTRSGAATLTFTPTAPLPALTRFRVTVPAGLVSGQGRKLAKARTTTFTTKKVATARVQQLLATLGYLPLSFRATGAARAAHAMAATETGTFAWKWSSARSVLGSYWSAGKANSLTRSAVMDFQRQHGLATDGVAGPRTAAALVKDALTGRRDADTYNYVHVSKTGAERLTLWADGVQRFHVAVSTGIRGATTYDGLFPVYAHMYYTRMRGTDVDGTKYDDNIYWASYFNGGEALHAYPRASYGFPQSNGCVEIKPANAKAIWPHTPVGTPVVITG